MEWNIRLLDRKELAGFRPYLLPGTAAALERSAGDVIAVGAVSGRNSVGAAAVRIGGDGGAVLTDLFVDAAVRRQGVGTGLLAALLGVAAALGCETVVADYVLEGGELAAMDALLAGRGFTRPRLRARGFCAPTGQYRQAPIIRRAFNPRYRTPERVVSFDQLPREALEELELARDIPQNLSWPHLRSRALPELSVAYVREGKVLAYQLGAESADGGYVLLSAVSREEAPPFAFILLLLELLNRCWYRAGGGYPFYFSATSEYVERLARRLMGGRCTEYEEHICLLRLPAREDGEGANAP